MSAYHVACAYPKPDVVTAQDPFELGFAALLVARHFGVPLHVQLHTDPFGPGFVRAHWPLNYIRRFLMDIVLRRASRIRVVSKRLAQTLQERYKIAAPITVLPIYVDTQRFATAAPDAGLVPRFAQFNTKLLVVARLEPEKNISLAIRSFAEAAPADSCLIIVGEGSELDALRRLAAQWKVDKRVFFEGAADPAPYYKLADLVLVPSRYEGYGLVMIEALAAGTPVISTDVGIAREVGAIVADTEDFPGALAEWFRNGPRDAGLKSYPYQSAEEYIRLYTDDIVACADTAKAQ
jgi:glycosyltransferase involved in cell wall biosynthesis